MAITRKLSPVIGFHGCDRAVAEDVLAGNSHLTASENAYDWLGSGVYFWVDSFARAYHWAESGKSGIRDPYVIGAFLDPGYCLDLTDFGATPQIKRAYELFVDTQRAAGVEVPANTISQNGTFLVRKLDCAVINFLHKIREANAQSTFDTVYGVFEEGSALFQNSALKEKTHIQIAVRNIEVIRGYFRPQELCDYNQ